MANGNYDACKAVMLKWEGGTSDHPNDPGGFTSRGVTAATGAAHRKRLGLAPKRVDKWTAAEVDRFYLTEFWDGVNGELLAYGVDLATFDAGVNSGVSRGAKWLQSVVGVKRDGKIGHDTLKAAIEAGSKVVIQKLCAKRLGFVQGLRTWKTFGKGWARRIADIEARAVAMWLAHTAAAGKHNSATVAIELTAEARKADDTSQAQGKGAVGTAAGGGVASGADVAVNGGAVNWWLVAAVGAAVLVMVIVLTVKARQNAIRAEAYRAVAAEVKP